jgi:hypothetical protein
MGPQHVEVGGMQRERLFAQHVLAGLRGGERERHVQVIGQRVVDGLDRRVGEQRLVRSVGPSDAVRGRRGVGRCLAARGDRRELDRRPGAAQGRDEFLGRDPPSRMPQRTGSWLSSPFTAQRAPHGA